MLNAARFGNGNVLERLQHVSGRSIPRSTIEGLQEPEIDWIALQTRTGFGVVAGIDNENDQALKGHLVDASALRGDEGRGTLR